MLQLFRSNALLKRAVAPVAASLAAIVGIGAFTAPAQAEFEQGDYELRLNAFAENDVNFDGVTFFGSGTLGYFISDQFEAGLRQAFSYTDVAVPGSALSGQTTLFVNYHIGEVGAAFQPFIGASVGYQYGDQVTDLFLGGPEAGIKYFFNEDWFVFGEVQYLFYFEDVEGADEQFDDGEFNYGLGLGVLLGND